MAVRDGCKVGGGLNRFLTTLAKPDSTPVEPGQGYCEVVREVLA
jgi:hypothetical protein